MFKINCGLGPSLSGVHWCPRPSNVYGAHSLKRILSWIFRELNFDPSYPRHYPGRSPGILDSPSSSWLLIIEVWLKLFALNWKINTVSIWSSDEVRLGLVTEVAFSFKSQRTEKVELFSQPTDDSINPRYETWLSLITNIRNSSFTFLDEKSWLKEDDYKILLFIEIHSFEMRKYQFLVVTVLCLI